MTRKAELGDGRDLIRETGMTSRGDMMNGDDVVAEEAGSGF